MKIGMPNVVMRYPRRLTVVRNSKVATVLALRQRLTFCLCNDVEKNVFHRREHRLETVNLNAGDDERSKKVGRLAARRSRKPPHTTARLHCSGRLRDRGQGAVHLHANLWPRMLTPDVVDAAVHDEPAAMDERDAIAERFGVPYLVSGEHRRTARFTPLDQQI